LASWASDACAVEAAPELRSAPHGSTVRFDDIMDALRLLDKQLNGDKYRRVLHRRRIFARRHGSDQSSSSAPLHWSEGALLWDAARTLASSAERI